MKKQVTALCVVAAAALMFVGCGGSKSKGPDAVALEFANLVEKGEFQKAGELADKDTKQLLAMFAGMASEEDKPSGKATYKVLETKIDGDTAKVKMEKTEDGESESDYIDLVKEDGTWKVHAKK